LQLHFFLAKIWKLIPITFLRFSGTAQEHEAKRFVSCSDEQDVTITLYPAKDLIIISTADFHSSIAKPGDTDFLRPVIFMSPGNSVQLLQVRVQSRQK
jgi:hypothetical protein